MSLDARGSKTFGVVSLTVCSIGGAGRAMVDIPIVYHRPIPPDGRIKIITATRRGRPAGGYRWDVQFVVDLPDPAPVSGDKTLAVDIGWRTAPQGIRVATTFDGEAVRHHYLPAELVDRAKKHDGGRSRHALAANLAPVLGLLAIPHSVP